MQQSGTSNRDASKPTTAAAPPIEVAKPREEDSGLHDIRSLAQSTKQRIKRTTGNLPHITQKDEDVLSSSSASWKNLALPQPAAMVSLPALQDLPNPAQAKREAKEQKAALNQRAAAQAPVSVSAIEASSSMSGSVEYKPAFSSTMPQARPAKSNKTRTIALIGMGVAAAAGITIYIATQNSAKNDAAQPTAAAPASNAAIGEKAPAPVIAQAPTVTPIPETVDTAAAAGSATATGDEGKVALAPPKSTTSKRAASGGGGGKKLAVVDAPAADNKVAAVEKPVAKSGKPEEGDPDFNQLLKEAGVKDKKTVVKLDKKELTSDDFKKGMAAITSKAQACYKGTQGSANVKLTIAPSGSVSKVTVSGAFAGKPEADCVAAAVKSASFPAWDGGPQSFGYPILLSE